jgi:hypothetical protein
MITMRQSFAISLAIVAVSFAVLGPRVAHPVQPIVLLNESVTLTEYEYQKQFSLSLSEGDQLQIQVTGNGALVNLKVTPESSPSQPVLDEEAQTFFSFEWTVPKDGLYVFNVSSETGANAAITVTKT